MSGSSKGTRIFSKTKVLILVVIIVLIFGYSSSYLLTPAKSFTTTTLKTQTQTTTLTSTATSVVDLSSGSITSQNSTSSTSIGTFIDNSSVPSTVFTSSTTTAASSSTNPSSISTSQPTTTTSSSGSTSQTTAIAGLYTISIPDLESVLNITHSSGIQFTPDSNQSVPYYVVSTTGSTTSTLGLVYLDSDISPSSCHGYVGPIGTLAYVNTTGFIKYLYVWSTYDTGDLDAGGYLITQTWLNTYIGRSVFEPLIIGQDAQTVTGATVTSNGIINGTRDAGRIVVNNYQQQQNVNAKSSSGTALEFGAVLNVFSYVETSYESPLSLIALGTWLLAMFFFLFKKPGTKNETESARLSTLK